MSLNSHLHTRPPDETSDIFSNVEQILDVNLVNILGKENFDSSTYLFSYGLVHPHIIYVLPSYLYSVYYNIKLFF